MNLTGRDRTFGSHSGRSRPETSYGSGLSILKIVYICHPFRDDPMGNQERVRRICKRLKADCVPLAPQLMLPAFIDEATERDLALQHCLRLVAAADEVRVFGEPTEGMRREIAEAQRLRIPVVLVNDHKSDDPRVGTARAVGSERARC